MDPVAHIRALLAAVRARLRLRRAIADAALVLLVAAIVAVGLLAIAAAVGPHASWRSIALAAAGATGVALAASLVRPLLLYRDEERLARFVGRRTGLGDLVWSAVELARSLPAIEREPELHGTSPALVRALLANAAARCRQLDAGVIVDTPPLRGRLIALGVALVGSAGLLVVGGGMLARGWRVVATPAPPPSAPTADPIVGDLEVTLDYPRYMALAPRTITGTSGEVLAPLGTVVALKGRALKPAHAAELVVDVMATQAPSVKKLDAAPEPVRVSASGALETRFTVAGAGHYRFVLETDRGRVREDEGHRVEVEPDRAPHVELRAAADDLEVTGPRTRVELGYAVDDDHGLGDLELVWRPDGERGAGKEKRALVRKAVVPASGIAPEKETAGRWVWDLADVELAPGERVAYHLEARDNDDVSGPHVGSSRTFYLHLYSPDEKHEQALQKLEELVDHAVLLLGDRIDLDVADRDDKGDDDLRVRVEARNAVHNRTEGFVAEIARLLGDLDKDPLAPRDLKPALTEIHDRVSRLSHAEEEWLRALRVSSSTPTRPQWKVLTDGDPRHVAELEKDVLLLDDMMNRQRLEQLVAIADQMKKARDRLKDLLQQYKRSKSDALKKDIEREMREIERKLAELEEKASRLSGDVPDEYLNKEAMGDNDVKSQMDQIREMLAKGEVDKAIAALDRMSQSMDRMSQALDGDLRGFRNERFSAEEKALAELESKIADLEQDERGIQQETSDVRERYQQEAQRQMKDKIEPAMQRLKQQASELRKKAAQIDPKSAGPFEQDLFEKFRRDTDDIQRALDANDLDEARSTAEEAERLAQNLQYAMADRESRQWTGARGPIRKAREQTGEAQGMARKIADEINELQPRPDEMLSKGDKNKLEELRQRQQAARRRLEELQRDLERRGQGQRTQGGMQQAEQGLDEAGQHMQRAEGKLGGTQPREAAGEEQQALDRLGQLRRDVQQQRRPNEGNGGRQSSSELVKIPGADEFKAPDYRQDLLEAMKRRAPDEYKERVKRFYEELAR